MTDITLLKVATIIPGGKAEGSGVHLAQGTKVVLSDGSELIGVTGITLRAEAGGIWKAVIEVYPDRVLAVTADAEAHVVETTALSDDSRSYGLVTHGCPEVPRDGTFLLEKGERVSPHDL
jgi:hypothetical protein